MVRKAFVFAAALALALSLARPLFAAEQPPAAVAAAGTAGGIAAVVALPVQIVSCATTVLLGGIAYGLTLGIGDLVEDELLAAIPGACANNPVEVPGHVMEASLSNR